MKIAEELFDQYKNTHPIAGELLHREMFKAVIEFHDKEIISLIDDEIVEQGLYKWNHTVKVLTELKQKIQSL